MRRKARQATKAENRPRFWGRHAVAAALANPEREVVRIWATREAAAALDTGAIPITYSDVADLGRMVPRDAPHQGLVAEVERLDDILLADLLDEAEDGRPLVVLDQVTDPHNVGAILRSAAAFGALGLVTQDRHAPPESGALAKAASGALETVPWVRVVNLARALDDMAQAGFWRIGLTGEAETTLAEALGPKRVALVLGAEGEGMRQNTESHCDALARLPISGIESLNVSNAAAVALYAARLRQVATKAGAQDIISRQTRPMPIRNRGRYRCVSCCRPSSVSRCWASSSS
jgi:23S rRNA (guanosine2251-2'-O)-methyltransferase